MNIAITGATGFAGRHVLAALFKAGHTVTALARGPAVELPGAAVVTGDLASREALDRLTAGAEAVVHLAGALAGIKPFDYFVTNAEGTARLVEAAVLNGVRRFIHVSSLAAREPALSAYAASKRAGEELVLRLIPGALVLRPPAVYGPGDRAMLPLFRELTKSVALIPGRREARFSLLYVDNLARIITVAVDGTQTGLHEVSDGRVYGWDDVIAIARSVEGRNLRPVFLPKALASGVALAAGGVARVTGKPGLVNRGKVNELYHGDWVSRGDGWPMPQAVQFEEGFRRSLAWYRAAGWLPGRPSADRSRI